MSHQLVKDKNYWCLILLIGSLIAMSSFYLRYTAVDFSVVDSPIRADARDYFFYAYNLQKFNIYSRSDSALINGTVPKQDALRSPGFPFLASIFINDPLTEAALENTLFCNVLLSVLTVIAIFTVAAFIMPLPYAVFVGVLTSISPHLVNANIYYLSETLSAFLICMFICIFYLACIYKKNNLWFFIGLILGAAALVRPFILYFVFVLVLLVVITPLVVEKLKVVLILLLGFFFLVAPWSLRNHHHFGYLADDTLIINTLIHGMYPDFMFQENPESYGFPYRHDPHAEEVSKSVDTALGEIKKRFSEDPVKHLHWYIIGKPLGLWSWNIVQGQGDAFIYPVKQSPYYEKSLFQFTHTLSKYSHVLCVIFAALASLLVWVQKLSAVMVSNKSALYTLKMTSLLLIYTTVLHMVGAPFPRYSIPLRPELYLMACFFVYLLISFIWSKKSKNS